MSLKNTVYWIYQKIELKIEFVMPKIVQLQNINIALKLTKIVFLKLNIYEELLKENVHAKHDNEAKNTRDVLLP